MTKEQFLENLEVPAGPIDVVLDTDAFNEIDDQFAIAYMFRYAEKLRVQAIYAAPFHNHHSNGPEEGMERSYDEIIKLLGMLGEEVPVYKGSRRFMSDETHHVTSPAAADLVRRAKAYSPENPLYVVAIAAITNVASALLIDPSIAENIVIVWLGGHARHYTDTAEFNMRQDYYAARIVMGSGAPFVQLPCDGVVSEFTISGPELEYWLVGKNELSDYLARNVLHEATLIYDTARTWAKAVWDVTAVAWLVNDGDRFMESRVEPTYLPGYNGQYEEIACTHPMRYVYKINRDALMGDLIEKLTRD